MPLRFTIRDLLWLTALVAMGFGWRVDRRQIQATNVELQAKNAALESNLEMLKTGIEILKEGTPSGKVTFRLKE